MRTNPRNKILQFLASLACFGLIACVQHGQFDSPPEGKPLSKVVVLPVLAGEGETGHKDASIVNGVRVMQELLEEYFAKTSGVSLLSREGHQALAGDFTGSAPSLARRIGQEMKAEGVLTATMFHFRDRQGTEGGLSGNPASVAFELRLIDTVDGKTLWTGVFDETQQAVLDNLFSFGKAQERGFRWVSAAELAREGVFGKLASCPFLPATNPYGMTK